MSMRVATFSSRQTLLDAAMRVQARQAEMTLQQASGQVSDDYGGLGATSGKVLSLETALTRSQAYASAATTASGRVEAMYDAIGSITDLVTTLKANLISFAATTDTASTLAASAEETLEAVASLLNTQSGGRYLFAGSAVDTAPVDLDALETTATTPSSADTSYYQGDDAVAAVKVSSDRTVSYGVTADDDAFETVIRALRLVAGGADDADTRAEAEDLLDTALDGLTALQSGLSLDADTLETVVSDAEAFQDYASGLETDLSGVDIASVAAQLSTYDSQLEAAYAAIGTIQGLSLVDYLR
jgi:flagellar hook-associated protein 3 FlgL